MPMKTHVLIYIICVFFPAAGAYGARSYQFRHLSDELKLSSKLINAIYQDDKGFIYFGTASGLDRYDGYSVRSFTRDDGDSTALHDGYVQDIQRAPDGRLWVRAGGTYSIFDPDKERFYKDMTRAYASMGLDTVPSHVQFASDGSCWMYVDGCGLFRYKDGGTVQVSDADGLLLQADVCDIVESSPGRIMAINTQGGMAFVDMESARVCESARVPWHPPYDQGFMAYADREGLLWVYSVGGLWLYSDATNTWHDSLGGTPLPQGYVMSVLQDRDGRVWIGYDHDGIVVFEKNGHMQRVVSDPDNNRTLSSNIVTVLMEDRTGSIWVGSRKNGVSVYDDSAFKFDFTPYPDINCISGDSDGRVWAGTDSRGLLSLDRNTGASRIIATGRGGQFPESIASVAGDGSGGVWCGTFGGGLLHVGASGAQRRFTLSDGLVSDNVWGVHPMSDGTLLLGTLGEGLQRFDPHTRRSEVFDESNSGLPSDFVSSLCEAEDGTIYVGTAAGLGVYDPEAGTVDGRVGNAAGTQRFTDANINQVMCDSRGLLWVATRDGLVAYDADSDSLCSVRLGTHSRFVLGIAEDKSGKLWASVGSELVSIAVARGDSGLSFAVRVYDGSDGLQACDFNQRSLCAMPDGEMMVGGFFGINSFRPESLKCSESAPRVFFTDLSLFNIPVGVGEDVDGRVILPKRLSVLDGIELDYDDNEFSVSFATDGYVKPDKTTYYYLLEGFSDEWRAVPAHGNSVSYTNLAPGRYTLRVKAQSGDGLPSENEASLGILIHPPFYATAWAKLLYVLAAFAFVFWAFRVVRAHERRLSKRRESVEAARKQEELDQLKFRFFANVSHELRTPLTLITAPLESLLKKELDGDTRGKLEMIHGNATRLLAMVNQLLDFRKNEVAGLALNASRGDIVSFVRSICDSFLMLSEKKGIHLKFFSSVNRLFVDFDEDKMGKIVMNLLSNAFKYTPVDGRVDVSLSLAGDVLELTIADSGCGIPDAEKDRIFERFYQGANQSSAGGGTGIGLSLVAEFVRLHGGTVAVADNAVRGAVFTVALPVRGAESATDRQRRPSEGGTAPSEGADVRRPRLLVVDDNADLLKFFTSELGGEFSVVAVTGGAEALEEVQRHQPDIIVSDLMMPGMDGIELCRRLKSDAATASIPLLILTAKHEVSAKIEGLTLGADDYMTKPFNVDELRLRVTKLLRLRRRGAGRALIEPEPQSIAITSLDEKLIERAVGYVEENMSRADLSVEELAAEMGMSRVHLYKRLKQITGKTPIEFIRLLRLKRAAQLLRESQLNISEIAYRCGFNNPKYFSRYFKDEFGVLPSVYQENEGK